LDLNGLPAPELHMKTNRFGLTPREHRVSLLPPTIGSMVVLAITMFNGGVLWPQSPTKAILLAAAGLAGLIYLAVMNLVVMATYDDRPAYPWVNAVLAPVGMTIITYSLPQSLEPYVGVLLVLAAISSSIMGGRVPCYVMIALTIAGMLAVPSDPIGSADRWALQLSVAILAIIVVEAVQQLKAISHTQVLRLETISEFSRRIAATLDRDEVMALLSTAFQSAVKADTYFAGMRDGDELHLELVYDDGEYFKGERVKLEGSLSSWVLENQRSLFLPDLRKEVDLPGVRVVLAGRHRTSLSWLGVPMRGTGVDGIIAVGSYRPNAFDRGDLELLTTLAQRTAQALDTATEHQQLAYRAKLDSLTGVYNHGAFLRILQEQADRASTTGRALGLIMLDIDHFKSYNDTYGHLVGDEILTAMCECMKRHIKKSDYVGRWGGEEFVIALPNATASQLLDIATRVRHALSEVTITSHEQDSIPAPTVSQGLAIFPDEASTLVDLIHLADQRLYMAKARGRNQIEPAQEQVLKATTQSI
jgi:diguanylate cyclase (GGDEF)-like protein